MFSGGTATAGYEHMRIRAGLCSRDGARFAVGRGSGAEMGEAEQRIDLSAEPGSRQEGQKSQNDEQEMGLVVKVVACGECPELGQVRYDL